MRDKEPKIAFTTEVVENFVNIINAQADDYERKLRQQAGVVSGWRGEWKARKELLQAPAPEAPILQI